MIEESLIKAWFISNDNIFSDRVCFKNLSLFSMELLLIENGFLGVKEFKVFCNDKVEEAMLETYGLFFFIGIECDLFFSI